MVFKYYLNYIVEFTRICRDNFFFFIIEKYSSLSIELKINVINTMSERLSIGAMFNEYKKIFSLSIDGKKR